MNSYSSVALVSRSIHNVLRYMNLISDDTKGAIETNTSGINAVDDMNCESKRTPL